MALYNIEFLHTVLIIICHVVAMKPFTLYLILALFVSACSKQQSQSEYGLNEVGQLITAEYGIVYNVRLIDITGSTTSASTASPVGATVGGMTGPAGTYVGGEVGSLWGSGMGAAEEAATAKKGYEYTVVTESNVTKTLVQYQNPEDIVFKPGDLVLIQSTGSFHRILSTANLPSKITEAHRLKIENPSSAATTPTEPPKEEKKPADPAPSTLKPDR